MADLFPALDRRMHCNAKENQNRRQWLIAQENGQCGEGRGGGGRKHARSAETSKQSKPQMPLLINTQCEADVYPDNPERKSQQKPERFMLHKQGISWGKEWQLMGSANFSS